MRNSKNIRRKGFTLVELLIVIVVIGILSAMMMLSSTEATTSAKATAIVANLRNIKTATLAWYADHPNSGDETPQAADIVKYLKDGSDGTFEDGYNVSFDTTGWYAVYTIKGTETETTQIKTKLKSRAAQTGLTEAASKTQYNDNGTVGMFIR